MRKVIIIGIVVVAIVGIASALSFKYGSKQTKGQQQEALPGKPYQAVFLTNGQVYFGKISKQSSEETQLTDVYYLQVQQPIQPPPEGQTQQQQQQVQLSLVKLGSELHKPKDVMVIRNDHILFTEEIQEDGQVIQAIRKFQREGPQPAPSPSPSPSPTPERKGQ